ncbi:MAG: glycosyltransferase [Planctomycetaceae bacterium]
MRVLSISPELPSPENPGTMAATARQLDSLRALGVDVQVLEMKGIPKLKYLAAIPRMRSLLQNVDLVHAHYGYCGWLARLQWRKPIVMSYMGSDLLGEIADDGGLEWLSRVMLAPNRRLAGLVDEVIVKSEEMARIVAPIKAHVIANGVDLEAFQPRDKAAVRRELGWSTEGRYVLFPGNPDTPRKGYPLASEAVQCAAARMVAPIEIVPLKGVSPDRVAAYMNACDAMLMTSLIEGSPNVVKEAMACNLPVAGVPVGDVEQMLDGVPGYRVGPRDAAQLGVHLVELLNWPRERVEGRSTIRRRGLDLEGVARRVLDVYDEALGRLPESRTTGKGQPRHDFAACIH